MDTKSQNEHIYLWLLSGNSITTLDAMVHHHIGRLASRVCDLIKDYNVPICKEREPNADGKGYHTRYWMDTTARKALKDVPLQNVHTIQIAC